MKMRSNKIGLFLLLALLLQSCAAAKYSTNADYPKPKSTYQYEGTLKDVFYKSSEPNLTLRRAYVYLPKGYETSGRRYPVLYLLHGARGNETIWIDHAEILRSIDSLTRCGAMYPTIVVFPNMNQYNSDKDFGRSRLKSAMESFYEVDGTVERAFPSDVVAATDSLFRTIPEKKSRAVAGLSIGAMQSIYISANYPELFGYVGMFSPMIHSFIKPGKDNSFYSGLSGKLEAQFDNPPDLYILMIGKTDFFYHPVKRFDRKMGKKGYTHEVRYARGGHEWYNWKAFCEEFLTKLWKYNL